MFSIIILAAGLGKRMQMPDTPKVLASLKEKPLIYYVLKTALSLSPEKIVLIVGYRKELVIEYVSKEFPNSNIVFVEQEKQLGTGDAAKVASKELKNYNADVLILAGDVPMIKAKTLREFIEEHKKNSSDISVLSAVTENPTGYGRVVRDNNKQFQAITEEKDADEKIKAINEVNTGIYFLNAKLLFELLDQISDDNQQKEYYLTDIVHIGKKKNLKLIATRASSFDEFQGVNTQEQLLELEVKMIDE